MVKHTRDIAVIAGCVYFVQGALGISGIALPLYLRSLNWTVSEITTVVSISAFPWVLKILYGLLSDVFPIAGLRRKSYLILCSILSVIGWGCMALLPGEKHLIMGAMIISNLGLAATDVITDGLIVEHSNAFTSPIYQSIAWGSRSAGAFLSGFTGGWLAQHWEPRYVFMISMCLPIVITLVSFWIIEKPVSAPPFKDVWSPIKRCFGLIQTSNIRYFIAILIFGAASSTFGTPFFFHLKEKLGFQETFLGMLSSLGWVGAMLGSFLYMKWFRKYSPKTVLKWAMLINSINIWSTLFISDIQSAIIFVFLGGVLGCIAILPMMSTSASLTRQTGVEGTLFAILMSVFNMGQIFFGYVGGKVYEQIGLNVLILSTGVFALGALYFVQKLRFDIISEPPK